MGFVSAYKSNTPLSRDKFVPVLHLLSRLEGKPIPRWSIRNVHIEIKEQNKERKISAGKQHRKEETPTIDLDWKLGKRKKVESDLSSTGYRKVHVFTQEQDRKTKAGRSMLFIASRSQSPRYEEKTHAPIEIEAQHHEERTDQDRLSESENHIMHVSHAGEEPRGKSSTGFGHAIPRNMKALLPSDQCSEAHTIC